MATAGKAKPSSSSGATRRSFRLSGHSVALDRRVFAARGDLADLRLADLVFAPHYAAPLPRTVVARADVTRDDGCVLSEVLPGDGFDLLELSDQRGWGICTTDGAVGIIPLSALGPVAAPTHRMAVATAPLTDADGAVIDTWPLGTRFAGIVEGDRIATAHGFLASSAAVPVDRFANDPAAVAEMLVGVPGKPGGRSGLGLDAGGLLFLVLSESGHSVPRFTDLQRETLGDAVESGVRRRGDLIWCGDQPAILVDAETAITVADGQGPVARLSIEQLIATYGDIVATRRMA